MHALSQRDLRLLTAKVLGIPVSQLAVHCPAFLTPAQQAELDDMVRRRFDHEPLARILGDAEFWSLLFELSPETLEPRPDSEALVEAALRYVPQGAFRVLDLGTGSGCLLIALLHERADGSGTGVDRSLGAVVTARNNARRHHVADRAAFVVSDWCGALKGAFDLVISNPPYIASAIINHLEPDVRDHDPHLALNGGEDGFQAYRAIFASLKDVLKKDGFAFFEIGYDQGTSIPNLARQAGFQVVELIHDLAQNPRVVVLQRRETLDGAAE
jgi:release factor glutamine methyltransferase